MVGSVGPAGAGYMATAARLQVAPWALPSLSVQLAWANRIIDILRLEKIS